MKKVLVIGSLNMDFSINVDKFPLPGETVLGDSFKLIPGGKGANQAYAMGKLGVDVSMIGAVGDDTYGKDLIENLRSVNVNVDGIKVINNENTGCAFVNVNNNGENNIIVIGGANLKLNKEIIDDNMDKINSADIIVMQLEVPLDVISYVMEISKKMNKFLILDPAPAISNMNLNLLNGVDVLKPNITELSILTGLEINNNDDVIVASKKLIDNGVENVIVTLGEKGSILVNKEKSKYFETLKVNAVDSTAAGDSFIAGLAKYLAHGKGLEESIKYAHIVSAFSVTKMGAQSSIPSISELNDFIESLKTEKAERIIIDADPGTDDAFAILLAGKSKEFKIEGITTVAGNCSLENATNNTFKILDLCNRNDVKVYQGMSKALFKEDVDAQYVHGNNGLGGLVFEPIDRMVEDLGAVDYLIDSVNSNPGDITVVALGPLTNIACAINKNKDFAKNMKRLIIMGAAEDLGNITPYAEFNFYKDPHAAKVVFDNVNVDIVIVPLNVTNKLPLKKVHENRLQYLNCHISNVDNELAKFLYMITRQGAKVDKDLGGAIMNDPVTIMYLLDSSLLTLKKVDVDIILDGEKEGMSVIKSNSNSNISFAYDIDSEKCYKLLFKRLFDVEL